MPTTALIVEDDAVTREGLAAALAGDGITIARACGSGEEALALSAATHLDVALVDLGLPGLSGHDTIRRLRVTRPSLPVLVLSAVENPAQIVEAFEAGAAGYLLKGGPLAEVSRAVEQVREGLAPISPAVARHIVATLRGREGAPTPGRERLTAREHEILSLLVGGHAYAAIAQALAIGVGTVQGHIKSIYRKLEVSSKAEAVGVALTEGLVRRF